MYNNIRSDSDPDYAADMALPDCGCVDTDANGMCLTHNINTNPMIPDAFQRAIYGTTDAPQCKNAWTDDDGNNLVAVWPKHSGPDTLMQCKTDTGNIVCATAQVVTYGVAAMAPNFAEE